MKDSLLKNIYSSEEFRKNGHALVDLLADHLDGVASQSNQKRKVISWQDPNAMYAHWKDFKNPNSFNEFCEELIDVCIQLHNPKYIGHQISAPAPITALTSLLNGMLNNGMGVYEMGMAPTAMERVVCEELCEIVGYSEHSGGFLTSGGTLANLTALLCARSKLVQSNVWEEGNSANLAVMVSEEAHYCIDRAARIMGLGTQGIIKIPVDENYSMRTEVLAEYLENATSSGLEVFAIIGSAPSTATGIYDNLETIAAFANQNKLWFHIDGAHGGAAIFSSKYKNLMKGSEQADSIAIDGHKMMMMPAITTSLLFKNGRDSYGTFQQKASYLLEDSEEEDWYNLAKRTFECTKYMMSLHWFVLFKFYGRGVFDSFVTTLYDLGQEMGTILSQDSNFELAVRPVSNIVCFRLVLSNKTKSYLNRLNADIRRLLLEEGNFYIVQTELNDTIYLRCTIMNPFTTLEIIQELLNTIKKKGLSLSD